MALIRLTQGKVTLINDEIYDHFNQWLWFAIKYKNTYYAGRTNIYNKLLRLHIEVMKFFGYDLLNKEIDHIDRNGLNNVKSNLRVVDRLQNTWNIGLRSTNTSGYIGVSWHKPTRKWVARIWINKKLTCLGYYEDIIEAAIAYDNAARLYRKEFAVLNFPD